MPLTAAAALGALAFGHVEFGVTASIIVGSVPAVLIGSLFSSRAKDKYIRPAITFVILASGLKYVGLGTYPLAWTRPWRHDEPEAAGPPEVTELVPEIEPLDEVRVT